MPPLAILTGILLGSCAAIGVGLVIVLFLFYLLADDYPRLATEYDALLRSTVIFLGMTAICAVSFVGLIRHRTWRWIAQAVMWVGLALTIFHYMPES